MRPHNLFLRSAFSFSNLTIFLRPSCSDVNKLWHWSSREVQPVLKALKSRYFPGLRSASAPTTGTAGLGAVADGQVDWTIAGRENFRAFRVRALKEVSRADTGDSPAEFV